MAKTRLMKFLALLMAFSFAAAACGSDDSGDTAATDETTADTADEATDDTAMTDETTEDTAMEDETPAAGSSVDGVLTVGSIIPLTGDLAFLAPPEVAGLRLAEEDINAAGGVLGNPIVTIEGDSGDTNVDIANPSVDAQLADGADVIVGAASSAVSKTVIDKITGAGVIQFSMANTSPDFTTYNDNGLYFRTAPSDLLQGKVLADLVAEEGNASLSIIYRQESYGEGLANAIKENFEASGGTVDEFLAYAVDTENFDPEIDKLVAADSDAYVVVAFQEAGSILTTMNERGIGPVDKPVYGVDGFIEGAANEVTDPSILEGLKGTVPSVDLTSISDFTDRFEAAYGEPVEVFAYGAETYDAVVIVALAAEVAGTDDPIAIAAEINGVTKDGEKCTDFASCRDIIAAGGDPDYDGIGGPYEFVDAGEPSAASFRIMTYGADGIDLAQDVYVFAE
ncbi:MAG: ABC transporter substrate-binding protein [Acidimicrobiia bacterium]|nr:ABC transporter substrate-binding protein [Acidimicrobiia bacterium]